MKVGTRKQPAHSKTAPGSEFQKACMKAGLEPSDGLQAIKRADKSLFSGGSSSWSGSVDLDKHFEKAEPDAHRWDYGVGFMLSGREGAAWIEPHPASSCGRNPKEMIKKKQWLDSKLAQWPDLRRMTKNTLDAGIEAYVWLTGSHVSFTKTHPVFRVLSAAGLGMPRKIFMP